MILSGGRFGGRDRVMTYRTILFPVHIKKKKSELFIFLNSIRVLQRIRGILANRYHVTDKLCKGISKNRLEKTELIVKCITRVLLRMALVSVHVVSRVCCFI